MSTKTVPANLPADITAQNEELLRIVEKQRIVIQNLQKSLAIMTDERDNLLERNQDLEQERLVNGHGNSTRTSDGPVPPPRSPYRQNTSSPSNQQPQQDTGCATVWEPTLPSTYSYDRKPALEQGSSGGSSPQNSHHQEPPSPPQLQTSRSLTTHDRIDDDRNGYLVQQHKDEQQQQRRYAEEQAQRQREEQAQRQREEQAQRQRDQEAYAEEQARLQRQADEQARRQREQEAYVEEQTRLHRQAMEEQMRRQRQQDGYNDSQPRRQRHQDTHAEDQARWHRYQQDEQQQQQHHAVTSPDIHVDEQARLYHHQQQQEAYYAYTTDEPQSPALPSTPRTHEGQYHGPFTPGPMAGISVKILGSNIFTNDKGQEVIAFTISVRGKTSDDPNATPQEQWRIQKHYSDFLALDAQVQPPPMATCTHPN